MSGPQIRTPVIDPADLLQIAETLAESPRNLSVQDITEIADLDEDYVSSATSLGCQLNLFQRESTEDGDQFEIVPDMKLQVKQSTDDQRPELLRNLLHRYEPFVAFYSSLVKESSIGQAALQSKVLYDMDADEDTIESQFTALADYTELLEGDEGNAQLTLDTDVIKHGHTQDIGEAIDSPLAARLFLGNRLDDEQLAYMEESTIEDLMNALELFWRRPRSAIASAGRAVEDFQRNIGNDYRSGSTDYSSARGIGQLADRLHGDGLTEPRHLHGGNYLASLRNPGGGHGKDPETLERWDVEPEVAWEYTLASIHYMRSLFSSVVQDRQVL